MSMTVAPREDWSFSASIADSIARGIQQEKARRHEEKLFNALGDDRAAKRAQDLAHAEMLKEETRLMERAMRVQEQNAFARFNEQAGRDQAAQIAALEKFIQTSDNSKDVAVAQARLTKLLALQAGFSDEAANLYGTAAAAERIAQNNQFEKFQSLDKEFGALIPTLPADQAANIDAARGVMKAFGKSGNYEIREALYEWFDQYREQTGGVLNGLVLSSEEKPILFGLSSKDVPITAARVFTEVNINNVLGDLDFLKTFTEKLRNYSTENKSNAANSLLGITLRLARQQGIDLAKTDPLDADNGAPAYVKSMMRENRSGALSQEAEEVMMISPDGQRGSLPRANLQKALERGYRIAE